MHAPRMTKTALLALALVAAVALVSPQQIGVIVYKVALVTLAGVAGYILDRALFPYGRPDKVMADRRTFALLQLRRAVIVAASIIGVGMGL